ncbi:DNA-binding SARP family transcriptional activator [Stackebrandtia endophytica]|uniref:DNA-binding SARP family transcriptional activator n=1 Tax=Stackebrandtia endophytica TaxID=1496996 RepID=A0A543ASR9_9ACTN|nr:BTAD domain-containing putative transcriptional regulator [Stackebrandtia endophytica]TQL75535.1 DNA-binding SARP family transcriptional activator [Stackebrandtia endophytica]
MLIRILGTVEVAASDSWVKAGSPKQNCVLAALALSPNKSLSIDAIANRVWGIDPPASARGVIYGHVNRLRELLRPHHGVRLARVTGGGYRLDIATDLVDALHMRAVHDRARTAATPDEASRLWREVIDLWRGAALSGVSGDWADRTRTGLERYRSAAYTGYFDAELLAGRHRNIIGELEEQLSLAPDDEALVATLMLALHRDDRSAEALERYATLRERLRRERQREPGTTLRRLHREILRGDRVPSTREPTSITEPPVISSNRVIPRQLPGATASFTGRRIELATLMSRLKSPRDRPVVVIDGMAGVGKSTLATQATNQLMDTYVDGQIFIDLNGYSDATDPVTAHGARYRVLRSIGFAVEHIPATVEHRAEVYRSALAGKRLLLFLDNADDEAQVAPLLAGIDAGAAVITSRRRLTIDGATPMSLGELTHEQSRELLLAAGGPGRFDPSEDAALNDLATWCGGLPLALRIAAARLRSRPQWSVSDLLSRLRDDHSGMDHLAVGQRSVSAALALSLRQLTDRQRELLIGLAWFPGPDLTDSATGAVSGQPEVPTAATLAELVDANLLENCGQGRHRLHDLVRRFVRTTAAPPEGLADRVGTWYLYNTAIARDTYIPQPKGFSLPPLPETVDEVAFDDDLAARRWFIAEGDNIAAVISELAHRRSSSMVWQLSAVTLCHTIVNGDRGTTDRLGGWGLTAAVNTGDLAGEAVLRRNLGYRALIDDDWDTALGHFEPGLRLARETGNQAVESMILSWLGHLHYRRGELAAAAEYASMECAVNQGIDQRRELDAINNLAVITTDLGRLTDAKQLLQEALPRFQSLDHPGVGTALGNLAEVSAALGELEAALRYEDDAEPHLVGDTDQVAALLRRSQVHRWLGDRNTALGLALRALRLTSDSAVTQLRATALTQAAAACDDPDSAARYARESIEAAELLSDVAAMTLGHLRLAEALLEAGNTAEAGRELELAELTAAETGREPLRARVAIGIARLRLVTDAVAAESVLRDALDTLDHCGHRPWFAAGHLVLTEIHDTTGDTESLARQLELTTALFTAMGSTPIIESVRRRPAPVSTA